MKWAVHAADAIDEGPARHSSSARARYIPAPPARHPRASLAERTADKLPVLPFLASRIAFAPRFDRAARLLAGHGAVSPRQAAQFFGRSLRLEIDPRQLNLRLADYICERDEARWVGRFFLDGGDWSGILSPLDQSPTHKEMLEICRLRENFRDGRIYRGLAARAARGQAKGRGGIRLDSVDKVDAYFQYYLRLVESIERSGILPRAAVGAEQQTGRNHRFARPVWRDLAERDIGVAIGPDGAIIRHTAGKHRVAVAIALGLTRIPVEIRLVHVDWLRGEMQRLGLPPSQALVAGLDRMRASRTPSEAG